MHRALISTSFFFAVLATASLSGAAPGDGDRQRTLEAILRVQDLRQEADPILLSALAHRDSAVRERAALACGSLQDTVALPRLLDLLHDTHRSIQNVAAFAIGQTGQRLSPAGRSALENEILSSRLARTQAKNRIIEEIGKFGTPGALDEILLKHSAGTELSLSAALSMSIARFAIRGITSDEGLAYLLEHCQPMELTLWQTVYALQRAGPQPQIRQNLHRLVTLRDHADPLLRMNVALLLGRYPGEVPAIASLQEMAYRDSDWRVRANAARVLASADTLRSEKSLLLYVSALDDGNPLVALAALAGLATARWRLPDSSGPAHDLLVKIESLLHRPDLHVQLRGESTITYATIMGTAASQTILDSLSSDALLLAYQLRGLGLTGSASVFTALREATAWSNPAVTCAAIDGALSLVTSNPHDTALTSATRAFALSQLEQTDVAVAATAASALGVHALRDTASVGPLIRRLQRLRTPEDIEAIQEVSRTLALLHDPTAIPALEAHLRSPDAAVRLAAREAIAAITGTDPIPGTVPSLHPAYSDFDFGYLRALPARPRVALETTRGTVVLELEPDVAPFTVMSFLNLALGTSFYNGTTFHRVVPNFVAQGGDPRGDGWGGPGYTVRSEFSPLRFETGTLGLASSGKDTEGCQFFITHSPQPHLDGRYTVFGRVIEGQEIVERILIGDRILSIATSGAEKDAPGR